MVSLVAYQDYQDRCRRSQKKKLDFHTRGTECACAEYCAKMLEVHGWLFSGIEELTIQSCTLLLFFDYCK